MTPWTTAETSESFITASDLRFPFFLRSGSAHASSVMFGEIHTQRSCGGPFCENLMNTLPTRSMCAAAITSFVIDTIRCRRAPACSVAAARRFAWYSAVPSRARASACALMSPTRPVSLHVR